MVWVCVHGTPHTTQPSHLFGFAASVIMDKHPLIGNQRGKDLGFKLRQFGGTPPPLLFSDLIKYFSISSFSKKPLIILECHSLVVGCRYSKIVTFLKYACIHSTLRITSKYSISLMRFHGCAPSPTKNATRSFMGFRVSLTRSQGTMCILAYFLQWRARTCTK